MSIQFIKRGGGGGFPPDWSEIGYEETPSGVMSGFNYAKEIADNWDSNITSMTYKYQSNRGLLIFPLVDTSNVINMQNAFFGSSLLSLPLIDTSNVEYMTSTFSNTLLTNFPNLNTNKVRNMNGTFSSCKSLEAMPLLDMGNVTTMQNMFNGCDLLKDIPEFNLTKCSSMTYAFSSCPLLSNDSLNNILGMCAKTTSYTGTKTLSAVGLSQAQAGICETLPNYQAFLDAGWTTGY